MTGAPPLLGLEEAEVGWRNLSRSSLLWPAMNVFSVSKPAVVATSRQRLI